MQFTYNYKETATDYYPGGMDMPGRSFGTQGRFGFNGKENDNESKTQDYGFRIYNPALGRFLSVDPLTNSYPYYTPYQFAGNKPVSFIDLDGAEEHDYNREREDKALLEGKMSITQYRDNQVARGMGVVLGGIVIVDIYATKGKLSEFFLTSRILGTLYHTKSFSSEQERQRMEEFKSAVTDGFIGWGSVKIVGGIVRGVIPVKGTGTVPQGLTVEEFKISSQRLYNRVSEISDDIVVHGSRANGTASSVSDIDFAIRVDSEKFDDLIVKFFGNPKEGTAKWKTMQRAIKTGKIQSGEARLRDIRKNLEKLLGKDVHISIIKKNGPFDNGITIPIKKQNYGK